jgi:hypothetical protein
MINHRIWGVGPIFGNNHRVSYSTFSCQVISGTAAEFIMEPTSSQPCLSLEKTPIPMFGGSSTLILTLVA